MAQAQLVRETAVRADGRSWCGLQDGLRLDRPELAADHPDAQTRVVELHDAARARELASREPPQDVARRSDGLVSSRIEADGLAEVVGRGPHAELPSCPGLHDGRAGKTGPATAVLSLRGDQLPGVPSEA